MKSYTNQRRLSLIFRYILLALLAIIWILPIVWIVLASFSYNDTGFVSTFWPEQFTLQNYIGIFTNPQYPFGNWIINTLIVSLASMIVSTFLTISVAYVLSRLRFRFRKPFLQIALVLGMFPGFMSMIALYYILKGLNMLNLFGLFLVYVGGAGLGFYVAKGFFDTIPYSIDEAARIDGASNFQIFTKFILPMSKPMLVYTALTSFTWPWSDFILPKMLLQDKNLYTVAVGLMSLGETEFARFAAGSIIIAIPIIILYFCLVKYMINGMSSGAVKE